MNLVHFESASRAQVLHFAFPASRGRLNETHLHAQSLFHTLVLYLVQPHRLSDGAILRIDFPTNLMVIFNCCNCVYQFAYMFDIGCFVACILVLEFKIFMFGLCIPNVTQIGVHNHFGAQAFLV